ncbi:hypothetical protein NDU88_001879 [Pleurodeles waltl]|uniref:Uncharacterized protein n=1 Tax=Pleurodeles waltl TaxID=8319 RepID=A0AAV7SBC0_PLEWA|nr:hypothetical protein NDU88_001879 [Pleurodeles waltl]
MNHPSPGHTANPSSPPVTRQICAEWKQWWLMDLPMKETSTAKVAGPLGHVDAHPATVPFCCMTRCCDPVPTAGTGNAKTTEDSQRTGEIADREPSLGKIMAAIRDFKRMIESELDADAVTLDIALIRTYCQKIP